MEAASHRGYGWRVLGRKAEEPDRGGAKIGRLAVENGTGAYVALQAT